MKTSYIRLYKNENECNINALIISNYAIDGLGNSEQTQNLFSVEESDRRRINTIFITHTHKDHFYYPVALSFVKKYPHVMIVMEKEVAKKCFQDFQNKGVNKDDLLYLWKRIKTINLYENTVIDKHSVKCFEVKHSVRNVGFIIDEKTMYANDFYDIDDSVLDRLKDYERSIDFLYLDCSYDASIASNSRIGALRNAHCELRKSHFFGQLFNKKEDRYKNNFLNCNKDKIQKYQSPKILINTDEKLYLNGYTLRNIISRTRELEVFYYINRDNHDCVCQVVRRDNHPIRKIFEKSYGFNIDDVDACVDDSKTKFSLVANKKGIGFCESKRERRWS